MTTIEIDDQTAELLNELANHEHIGCRQLVERLIKKHGEESVRQAALATLAKYKGRFKADKFDREACYGR